MNAKVVGFLLSLVVVPALVSPGGGDGSAAMAGPAAQDQGVASQPAQEGGGQAPPGRPQIEKRISPEEREEMGLAKPTWTAQGKVHPDVQKVLDRGEMPWLKWKGYLPDDCHGIAYVAVYLRHEQRGERASKEDQAAIKEVQSRVLSKLTAAEFRVIYAFKNTAGLLGFVTASGLAKLEKDADVVAVGLDEKPLPKGPPLVLDEERPSRQGERGKIIPTPPPERIGKIEADVYWALERSNDGYADVLVSLRDVQRGEGSFREEYGKQKTEARALQDRVLSALTAEEFRLRSRFATGGITGRINAAGLAKLDKDPDVLGIGLSCAFRSLESRPAQQGRAP